jgi:hypothetical protein
VDFDDQDDVSDEVVEEYTGGERLPVAARSNGELFCYSCGAGQLRKQGENVRGEVVLKCMACGELQAKSTRRREF